MFEEVLWRLVLDEAGEVGGRQVQERKAKCGEASRDPARQSYSPATAAGYPVSVPLGF
jgi:hypothetical protein